MIDQLSETELQQSIDRVERELNWITAPRTKAVRKRRVAIAVGAVALVSAGILIGAAAIRIADISNPGSGVLVDGTGNVQAAAFAVDCYSDPAGKSGSLEMQYNADQPDLQSVKIDPTLACDAVHSRADLSQAVGNEAHKLIDSGSVCGQIDVTRNDPWYFETNGSESGVTLSQSPFPATSKKCADAVTITVPATEKARSVVCAVAGNWVAVLPTDGQTAQDICGARDLTVWSD